ncbi:MAG: 16S rRNA (adenine(1518)-N(6)/adenine(1519)-N(6))-dimethyltransferase, partial [Cyclobacteriaceae bacterium]|nr:16S rRNA (adenine(1518)-N(6)/adenine(1519)-N(6))-dimethyltransferase [Cyclobacteriaceae bacterium]
MHGVRPKKFLGQHFLKDQQVAQKIVDALSFEGENESIIEVGPGTGVLTNFLVQKSFKEIILIEIDRESIALLNKKFIAKNVNIIEGDILK